MKKWLSSIYELLLHILEITDMELQLRLKPNIIAMDVHFIYKMLVLALKKCQNLITLELRYDIYSEFISIPPILS